MEIHFLNAPSVLYDLFSSPGKISRSFFTNLKSLDLDPGIPGCGNPVSQTNYYLISSTGETSIISKHTYLEHSATTNGLTSVEFNRSLTSTSGRKNRRKKKEIHYTRGPRFNYIFGNVITKNQNNLRSLDVVWARGRGDEEPFMVIGTPTGKFP